MRTRPIISKLIPMAAEAEGFDYYPHHSTAGFFCAHGDGGEVLINLRADHHLDPLLNISLYMPPPYTILSSSCGHILCRDGSPTSSYHVYDPLTPPLCSHYGLPDPPRPHAHGTPAIISFADPQYVLEFHVRHEQRAISHFYVVCAIDEGGGRYTFDTFCTKSLRWSPPAQGLVVLHDQAILAHTGVSCGRWAYWLTDGGQHRQPVVVMHDPDTHVTTTLVDGPLRPAGCLGARRRMQLGRVGDELGLVVVDDGNSAAELNLLSSAMDGTHSWRGSPRASTRIAALGDVEEDPVDAVLDVEPLRFESHKLEILFSVRGKRNRRRLVLWEGSDSPSVLDPTMKTRVTTILEDASPLDAANGVPYVLPLIFSQRFDLRRSPLWRFIKMVGGDI